MNVTVIGAGLAGSEAAWQLAQRGIDVTLREMKPEKKTPAHETEYFAELCCSNSLRSDQLENAVGLLKEELRRLGSLILQCADATQHLYAAGAELPPDALCQLPAALRFIPGQFFLIQLHASFSIPWQTLLFSKRLMRTSRQRVSRRCVVLYHRNLSSLR